MLEVFAQIKYVGRVKSYHECAEKVVLYRMSKPTEAEREDDAERENKREREREKKKKKLYAHMLSVYHFFIMHL